MFSRCEATRLNNGDTHGPALKGRCSERVTFTGRTAGRDLGSRQDGKHVGARDYLRCWNTGIVEYRDCGMLELADAGIGNGVRRLRALIPESQHPGIREFQHPSIRLRLQREHIC